MHKYRQFSDIRLTQFKNINVSRLVLELSFAQFIEARC